MGRLLFSHTETKKENALDLLVEDRGRLKLDDLSFLLVELSKESVKNQLALTPLTLSRSVGGRVRLQQARFPDSRLKRVGFTAFPISREISDPHYGS